MKVMYYRFFQFLMIFLTGVFFGVLLPRDQVIEKSLSKTSPESVIPSEFEGKLSLFILAGQSNMSGRGELLPEITDARIVVFGNDYEWHLAAEPVDGATGQIDKVSQDFHAGYSPAFSFAKQLLKYNSHHMIGLIPCAKGGSSIAEWQRNLSEKSLYGSCLKRVKLAATKGKISGVLFFQGEADALKPKPNAKFPPFPGRWAAKFTRFVDDFRGDLSQPDLPVVFAQIGSTKSPKLYINWQEVQRQQEEVNLSSAAMIYTRDLPLKDDVHFTTASYQKIGERFANQFWQLTQQKSRR
ncbi:sialate O-acetylesterase [Ancylothrix sp. C2]|uniref:sialate O-acetylesterase n=1 Tax=Ancylothrix sp. D3o TaxID=2953691 RepID=UPI0021BB440C|nr:sialate O-acetylesterase [Ancylothrix sp. D3o]MCT7951383.1 sialate O-acetylesterase [Ancylothrix sp. D3o]